MRISLNVNGEDVVVDAAPAARLVDVLRERLGLTGAKDACGRGDCGACTVLVGGRAVPSCVVLAARADGPVLTVEGLAAESRPLREALADRGGLQCGYCTPGFVVRGWQLLAASGPGAGAGVGVVDDGLGAAAGAGAAASPGGADDSGLRAALSGNFCRCTGYNGVLDALAAALPGTG